MWEYDSLIGKAQVYFARAREHPHSDDEEFALWLLLGLEFLLRAPLAQIHPSLLAAPEGNSILHSVGVTTIENPKSIPAHTVIDRLGHVIPGFGGDRQSDARDLVALRNNELHTGSAILAAVTNEAWLPRFTRVAEALCAHLGLSVEDLVGEEVAELGSALVDAEDKRLAAEVAKRIQDCSEFFQKLQATEVTARRRPVGLVRPLVEVTTCPACAEHGDLALMTVRSTDERLEDDDFVSDRICVATGFGCAVCGLVLTGTAEVKAAGLPQQVTRTERESAIDRFMSDYVDDDYGND